MSELITISGQITVDDVKSLANQGYKTLVNNRPDGEEPNQPSSDDIAKVAGEYGIEYRHIPFAGGMLGDASCPRICRFYNQSQRPLHIFCRSGNRSSIIYRQLVTMIC